jgi:hypothetical protein
MAKAGKRTNQIILKAGMTIGASAAEMDDEFLLPCVVSCPAVLNGHPNSAIDQLLPWAHRPQDLKAVA